MPLLPLVRQDYGDKVASIWVPPSANTGHLIRCAKCKDAILMGNVMFWEPAGADEGQFIPFCPPCMEWYRENQWWAKQKLVKAEAILNRYSHNMGNLESGGWEQWELDAKALRWGLEKRRKVFAFGGYVDPE